jgi:hypothetical protein
MRGRGGTAADGWWWFEQQQQQKDRRGRNGDGYGLSGTPSEEKKRREEGRHAQGQARLGNEGTGR